MIVKTFQRWGILAVLAAACLTGGRGWGQEVGLDQAKKNLEAALQKKDATALQEAVKQLVTLNNDKAIKALLSAKLSPEDNDLYWTVISGVASFTNPFALKELGKTIMSNADRPHIRDIMYMLKNNRAYTVIPMLSEFLDKGPEKLKLSAVDHLQEFKGAKEVVPVLLEHLKKEAKKNTELKSRLVIALESLTAQKLGDTVSNWEAWWNKEKEAAQAVPNPEAPALPARPEGGTVVDSLDPERFSAFDKLKNPAPTEKKPEMKVVVIQSNCKHPDGERNHDFDHIESVLASLGIPHTVIKKSEVAAYDFTHTIAVLINCNQFRRHCVCPDCTLGQFSGDRLYRCVCKKNPEVHIPVEPRFTDDAIRRLAQYVNNGGYLFTEDWVLEEMLAKAFPQYVKDAQKVTPEQDVIIMPEIGALSHPYMNRIFGERLKTPLAPPQKVDENGQTSVVAPPPVILDKEKIGHRWKIDNESPVIEVVDKNKVTVLMISPDLGKKYGKNPVAITFVTGSGAPENNITTGPEIDRSKMKGGRVLHVMSHFGKQSSQTDEYTLQNLLLNFLIEANERRLAKEKKR